MKLALLRVVTETEKSMVLKPEKQRRSAKWLRIRKNISTQAVHHISSRVQGKCTIQGELLVAEDAELESCSRLPKKHVGTRLYSNGRISTKVHNRGRPLHNILNAKDVEFSCSVLSQFSLFPGCDRSFSSQKRRS